MKHWLSHHTVSNRIQTIKGEIENSEKTLETSPKGMYHMFSKYTNQFLPYQKKNANKPESIEFVRRNRMKKSFKRALKKDEFILYYQPQVEMKEGKVKSLEALIRWNSSEFGFVSPTEFISLSEETGDIIEIGKWVINKACLQFKKWINEGYKLDYIAVNVSLIQLKQQEFVETVKNILIETNISPCNLEIEITESMFLKYMDLSIPVLNKIRDMGIRIAIDDFGTKYSSLNLLRMFSINTLKIDKSFIDNIDKNPYESMIVAGIIDFGHKLNFVIVAEGIELEKQLEILKSKKCDKIQGYYFSKPRPASEIEKMLPY